MFVYNISTKNRFFLLAFRMLNNTNNEILKRMIVENKMQNKNNNTKTITKDNEDDDGDVFRVYPSYDYTRNQGIKTFICYTPNKILDNYRYNIFTLCCIDPIDDEIVFIDSNNIDLSEDGKKLEIDRIIGIYYDPFSYTIKDENDEDITLKIPFFVTSSDILYNKIDVNYYAKCGLRVETFDKIFDNIPHQELINKGYKTDTDKYIFYTWAENFS